MKTLRKITLVLVLLFLYITVIYRSGRKDLETYTKGLLRQNLSTN